MLHKHSRLWLLVCFRLQKAYGCVLSRFTIRLPYLRFSARFIRLLHDIFRSLFWSLLCGIYYKEGTTEKQNRILVWGGCSIPKLIVRYDCSIQTLTELFYPGPSSQPWHFNPHGSSQLWFFNHDAGSHLWFFNPESWQLFMIVQSRG